jgi:hypothetical protein
MRFFLKGLTGLFFFALAFFFSCNGNSPGSVAGSRAASGDTTKAGAPQTVQECYRKQSGSDTVLLQLSISGEKVTGTLYINYSGKDKNSGTLQGRFRNDTLISDYTFQSEGKASVREVAFIRKGDSLVEGFGEIEERNGKMVFKNASQLRFPQKMSLVKAVCQ